MGILTDHLVKVINEDMTECNLSASDNFVVFFNGCKTGPISNKINEDMSEFDLLTRDEQISALQSIANEFPTISVSVIQNDSIVVFYDQSDDRNKLNILSKKVQASGASLYKTSRYKNRSAVVATVKRK